MVTRAPAARGFTLPELLVVVGIVGVLGAVAAPSISTLVANQRARSAGSELMQSLLRARSEAVKRNLEVTVRPETGTSWQSGWRIPNPSDTAHPIEIHAAVPGATFTGPAAVVYQPNGRVRGTEKPSFDIAVQHADQHRCLQVDLSGRPSLNRTAC
jgi:type IV fimbrial biogenesis protein FimT